MELFSKWWFRLLTQPIFYCLLSLIIGFSLKTANVADCGIPFFISLSLIALFLAFVILDEFSNGFAGLLSVILKIGAGLWFGFVLIGLIVEIPGANENRDAIYYASAHIDTAFFMAAAVMVLVWMMDSKLGDNELVSWIIQTAAPYVILAVYLILGAVLGVTPFKIVAIISAVIGTLAVIALIGLTVFGGMDLGPAPAEVGKKKSSSSSSSSSSTSYRSRGDGLLSSALDDAMRDVARSVEFRTTDTFINNLSITYDGCSFSTITFTIHGDYDVGYANDVSYKISDIGQELCEQASEAFNNLRYNYNDYDGDYQVSVKTDLSYYS